MRHDDLPEVMAVERAAFTHPWTEAMMIQELETPHATIDLLWAGEQLAGYLCCWYICRELHILNVVTAPEFRRRGIAGLLLGHVFTRTRAAGFDRALLEVRSSNAAAIALYEKWGFRREGLRKHYYADGEDALLMTLLPQDLGRRTTEMVTP